MEPALDILRNRLDSFLSEVARLEYQYSSGRSTRLPVRERYTAFPELSRPQSFLELRAMAASPSVSETEKKRLRTLMEFLATQVEEAKGASATELIAAFEAAPQLLSLGLEPSLSIREAVAAIPNQPDAEGREKLERLVASALLENRGLYARRIEAVAEVVQSLGYDSYLHLREEVSGYAVAGLLKDCEQLLANTEDAYRDALAYALRRVNPTLRRSPGGRAKRHDLVRAAAVPWLRDSYAPSAVIPAVTRACLEWGFDIRAGGRIAIDSDDRESEGAVGAIAAVDVPKDIRLDARLRGGIADSASLLHALGRAQHLAHTEAAAPIEYRRLGDNSVSEAFGSLFAHLLLDPEWHRRYFRLPQRLAKEASQMAAFFHLTALRRSCAVLTCEVSLPSRKLESVAEEFQERLTLALLVEEDPAFFPYHALPQLRRTRKLRGIALAARLHSFLEERFNEDFWRNPAAGNWLLRLFARGQRDDAEAIGQELGGPLELANAGARLVRALNG